MREVKVGNVYKHFKGNIIEVLHIATDTESGNPVVVYTHLNNNESNNLINDTYPIWVRPLDMFLSEVDHVKYPNVKQKYRFEELQNYHKETASNN